MGLNKQIEEVFEDGQAKPVVYLELVIVGSHAVEGHSLAITEICKNADEYGEFLGRVTEGKRKALSQSDAELHWARDVAAKAGIVFNMQLMMREDGAIMDTAQVLARIGGATFLALDGDLEVFEVDPVLKKACDDWLTKYDTKEYRAKVQAFIDANKGVF
jgi:hypothetical protein